MKAFLFFCHFFSHCTIKKSQYKFFIFILFILNRKNLFLLFHLIITKNHAVPCLKIEIKK